MQPLDPDGPLSRTALLERRLKPVPGQQPAQRVWSHRRRAYIDLFDPAACIAMPAKRVPTAAQLTALAAGRHSQLHVDCVLCGTSVERALLGRDRICSGCAGRLAHEADEERDAERWAELVDLHHRSQQTVYLDTETTGLNPSAGDEILEIAVVGDGGEVLLNSLVRPREKTSWPEAQAIHGITPAMVEGAPALVDLLPALQRVLEVADAIVIDNAAFDLGFLPDPLRTLAAARARCAMDAYALWAGDWSTWHGGYRSHSLHTAASTAGYSWDGDTHRALADALALRHVWCWLETKKHRHQVQQP